MWKANSWRGMTIIFCRGGLFIFTFYSVVVNLKGFFSAMQWVRMIQMGTISTRWENKRKMKSWMSLRRATVQATVFNGYNTISIVINIQYRHTHTPNDVAPIIPSPFDGVIAFINNWRVRSHFGIFSILIVLRFLHDLKSRASQVISSTTMRPCNMFGVCFHERMEREAYRCVNTPVHVVPIRFLFVRKLWIWRCFQAPLIYKGPLLSVAAH